MNVPRVNLIIARAITQLLVCHLPSKLAGLLTDLVLSRKCTGLFSNFLDYPFVLSL